MAGAIVVESIYIANGTDKYDSAFNAGQIAIYPMIVTHDPMFDTPGLNKVLQSLFEQELAILQSEGIDRSRVRPLTIMNIDCLILMADLMRAGKLPLEDLLEAFIENSRWPKRPSYTVEEANREYPKTCLSLYDFLPHFLKARFGPHWRSDALMEHLFQLTQTNGPASSQPSENVASN